MGTTEDWTKKMWSMYTIEHYSAMRKDETLPFVTTRMNRENIMLGEISQTEKVKNCDFIHMWNIKPKAISKQTRKTNKNS